ncbi:MAG: hypothetical protein Q8P67_12845 [archaeon]|nr:hypothetical protein [archaeon]
MIEQQEGGLASSSPSSPLPLSPPSMPSVVGNPPTSRLALEKLQSEWREFDLEGRRGQLDSQAQAIAAGQDASKEARKQLGERGKEFQRLDREARLRKLPGLLSAYQKEIDRLTGQAKASSAAFFLLYQALAGISDPFPGLCTAVHAVGQKAALRKLQESHAGLEAEVRGLRASVSGSQEQAARVRELEEQLHRYQGSFEELVRERVHEVEQRLMAEQLERFEMFHAAEQDHKLRLQQSAEELGQVQVRYEASQSQLFAIQAKHAEELARKQAEIDRLSDELVPALGSHAAHATAAAVLLSEDPDALRKIASLEDAARAKDRDIERLTFSFSASQDQLSLVRESFGQQLEALSHELSSERSRVQALEAQLQQCPSAAEISQLRSQIQALSCLNSSVDDQSEVFIDDVCGIFSLSLSPSL